MPSLMSPHLNDELRVEFRILILAGNSVDRIATWIAHYPALPKNVVKRIVGVTMDPVVRLFNQLVQITGKCTGRQLMFVLLGH